MFSTTHICILFITLQLICLQNYVEPKDQYVQPLPMGLQVAIPWDIANIWNRPVSLSPFLSTFLGLTLLYILFFGVITSPFGYMFGVPSQKYILGIGDDSFIGSLVKAADQWDNFGKDTGSSDGAPASSRSFATPIVRKVIQYQWERPDFTTAVFQFTPNAIGDEMSCQQLILCYAHSSLKELPEVSTPIFRVFSKMLTNVTERQREAIMMGLDGQNCDDMYYECPYDIYSLVSRTYMDLVPHWLRRMIILPQF